MKTIRLGVEAVALMVLASVTAAMAEEAIPNGTWLGNIELPSGDEMPVTFEVKTTAGRLVIVLRTSQSSYELLDASLSEGKLTFVFRDDEQESVRCELMLVDPNTDEYAGRCPPEGTGDILRMWMMPPPPNVTPGD